MARLVSENPFEKKQIQAGVCTGFFFPHRMFGMCRLRFGFHALRRVSLQMLFM